MSRAWIVVALLALASGAALAQSAPTAAPRPADAQAAPARPPQGWTAAERRFRAAIQLQPHVAAFHASLGEALRHQGRLPEAAASYAEAVRLAPDNAAYRGELAAALLELRQWRGAEEQFRLALRLDTTRVDLHLGLASTLLAQGRDAEAVETYRRVLRLHPGHPEAEARVRELARASEGTFRTPSWTDVLRGLGTLFKLAAAATLVLAGAALVLPMLGALLLLLVVLPASLLRQRTG